VSVGKRRRHKINVHPPSKSGENPLPNGRVTDDERTVPVLLAEYLNDAGDVTVSTAKKVQLIPTRQMCEVPPTEIENRCRRSPGGPHWRALYERPILQQPVDLCPHRTESRAKIL